MKSQNILVAGGTGFLGFHILKRLKKYKFKLFSISTKKPIKKRKIKSVKYLLCDISKKKNLKKKLNYKFDYVINLSGYVDHSNKIKTFNSHYVGCKNLIQFINKNYLKKFIQIGSGLEYGNNTAFHKENFKCKPKSVYSKSKFLSSQHIQRLNKIENFKGIILRVYQVYGPAQDVNRLIPQVIKSSLSNKDFNCSEGNQLRDFLYIEDFVQLIIKIILNKKPNLGIYNVGSGQPVSIKKLVNTIFKKTKKAKPNFGKIKMRKDESLKMCPNISKIKKIFKWSPKFSLNKGLKKTIDYYNGF